MDSDSQDESLTMQGGCLPTLICIGGARCASSYLYSCFLAHPDVGWLKGEPKTLATVLEQRGRLGVETAYAGLAKYDVRGEKDPYYSTFFRSDVERVRLLLPEMRIVYVMRNPPERQLSHIALVRQRYGTGRSSKPMRSLIKMLRFAESPLQTRLNDCGRTIRIWRSVYPENQFMVVCHDEIVENQQAVLERIAAFADINIEGFRSEAARVRSRNTSKAYHPQSDFLLYYLTRRWQVGVQKWSQLYGLNLSEWISRNRRVQIDAPASFRLLYFFAVLYFGHLEGGIVRFASYTKHGLRLLRAGRKQKKLTPT